ncbi:hypothetical protein HU200_051242 [Digitaria exilis]|uniref:F-box domain-containing protein n=1 Tax=Digitaria exilis TaxID=1010633 RepID=A0A835B1R5_9POAL|nr:hypothetical protein HU200_051242 [Digitaria exilis]CAB3480078.1 unnamed protein product [Digitaria exilis]
MEMPLARRSRPSSSRPPPTTTSSAAAAAEPRGGRDWLSTLLRVRAKLTRRRAAADDDGTPLTDELLLLILAGVPTLADLVRCAATCRRWRRLVSAESASLSLTPRRAPGRFISPLALGFFHHEDAAPPRFVAMAMASASRRFPDLLLRHPPPSLSTLIDGELLGASSHIVAARNGLIVVDLRRGKHDRSLKLCVCNPMSGLVHVLPFLDGKEGVLHYACTVLNADDSDEKTVTPPRSSSYFRLVIVYTRHGFTVFRSYSSEEGSWSEEAKVNTAMLGQKQMSFTQGQGGIVQHGGRLVHWLARNVVFVLSLETLQSVVVSVPRSGNGQRFDMENTLLGLSPEERLCVIQFGHLSLVTGNQRVSIRVTTRTDRGWDLGELIQVEQSLPADVAGVRLKWFFEKSGVVIFSVIAGDNDRRRSEMYALRLDTRVVEKLVSHDREGDVWGNVHGYEMDQATYLASLAVPEGMEDM